VHIHTDSPRLAANARLEPAAGKKFHVKLEPTGTVMRLDTLPAHGFTLATAAGESPLLLLSHLHTPLISSEASPDPRRRPFFAFFRHSIESSSILHAGRLSSEMTSGSAEMDAPDASQRAGFQQ